MNDTEQHKTRKGDESRAFFGRRKGKALRKHQAELTDDLLPRLSVDLTVPFAQTQLFTVKTSFLIVEIGFGGGEHLVREALSYPDIGFIGAEPFINGMAKMLAEIERKDIQNVRLHPADASALIDWLPDASVDILYLLYPDPWPKSRHHKRRFVQDTMVERLARIIKAGGEFRFASDIDHYSEWTLTRLMRSPYFRFKAETQADWLQPWPLWQSTRYEAKALREGRKSCYLSFTRL